MHKLYRFLSQRLCEQLQMNLNAKVTEANCQYKPDKLSNFKLTV